MIFIKDRLKALRKELGLTQAEFAERLNLSRNFICMAENGDRDLSDRTISDICNRFAVNEQWLRTGEGDMFQKNREEQDLGEYIGRLLNGSVENDVKLRFISCLSKLDEDAWNILYKLACDWSRDEKKEQD